MRTHLKKRHPEKMTAKNRKAGSAKKLAPSDPVSDNVTGTGTASGSEPHKRRVASKDLSDSTEVRGGRSRPMCVRSFKCHLCSSAFVRVDSLRSHLRQHRELQITSQSTSAASTSSTNSLPAEVSEDKVISEPAVPQTEKLETVVSVSDTALNSIQRACENVNERQQSESDTCVLNVYHQPMLSQEGENTSDQVIEQALRQSGVLCLPSGALDCGGTTLNLVHSEAAAIEVGNEQSQTNNFFVTNDDGGSSHTVLNAITSLGSSTDVGLQTIQASLSPALDVSEGKTVVMNTANIEIPLSALSTSGIGEPAQLIYQMQPSIRLVPYRSPSAVQYVLKTTPTGCTQILFNSATTETGEPLQLQDISILQPHVDPSSNQPDNGFSQQLVNYVVSNGLDTSETSTPLVASVGDTVSRYLLVSTPMHTSAAASLQSLTAPQP